MLYRARAWWVAAALCLTACSSAATPSEPIITNLSFDTGRTVEVLTSRPLGAAEPQVRIAVIVIHGLGRKASINFSRASKAMRAAGVEGLVVAPRFKNGTDAPGAGEHFWKKSGWAQGNLSRDSRKASERLSSFEVVDRLYAELTMPGRFPNLRRIVLAGHSAGGQFVNRYLAVGRLGEGAPARGVEFRFLAANPSSYLYLDARRPMTDSSGFAVPAGAPPKFNRWRYGLEKRNRYSSSLSEPEIRENVFTRRVWYLIGSEDNVDNGNLARSAAAMAQGRQRHERWANYRRYVALFPRWPEVAHFEELPGVGHSGRRVFASGIARRVMFE